MAPTALRSRIFARGPSARLAIRMARRGATFTRWGPLLHPFVARAWQPCASGGVRRGPSRSPPLDGSARSGSLVQLQRVAVRVLDLDLRPAGAGLHAVPEPDAGALERRHPRVQ